MLQSADKTECENPYVSPKDRGTRTPYSRAVIVPRSPEGRRRQRLWGMRGFTLLEMMIVISIILILMAVAVPIYNQSILRARESVLRHDLFTLRSVISQYTLDKQKAP